MKRKSSLEIFTFYLLQMLTKYLSTLKTLHSWESNAHRYMTFKATNGFHKASSSNAHLFLHRPSQHEQSLLLADCSEHSKHSVSQNHKNVADYSHLTAEKKTQDTFLAKTSSATMLRKSQTSATLLFLSRCNFQLKLSSVGAIHQQH